MLSLSAKSISSTYASQPLMIHLVMITLSSMKKLQTLRHNTWVRLVKLTIKQLHILSNLDSPSMLSQDSPSMVNQCSRTWWTPKWWDRSTWWDSLARSMFSLARCRCTLARCRFSLARCRLSLAIRFTHSKTSLRTTRHSPKFNITTQVHLQARPLNDYVILHHAAASLESDKSCLRDKI